MQDTLIRQNHRLNLNGKIVEINEPKVVGILNVTPDSFHSGSRVSSVEQAIRQAGKMIEEGAFMLDIGAASSRPGAGEVPVTEELDRILPVIEALTANFPETPVSADTYRSEVARAAVEAGAAAINDISAGDLDNRMIATVAGLGVPYIIMHMQGTPETMQHNPQYEDVVTEVLDKLAEKVNQCAAAGINDIIVDPGFGFGKTVEHNYRLLKYLNRLALTGCPVMVGISRKSMINKVLGTRPAEALNGTTALHMIALLNGADFLRVHDVKEAVECVKIYTKYKEV